ncbi:hypothetical protein [Actinomadura sp. HBU206391]|uniref:hypothetical protein n=1 Tax=Actinomadura sp. HBU206391 TaxID=2731692 RepID=UPI00164F2DED|nr:hypothetical protein [Actinomadura sp. HBU206391]MBC6460261.1 hypothetical protein [Actinomadura sp. HBU206391]
MSESARTGAADPGVVARAVEQITAPRLLEILRMVADVPAPSGASSPTRGIAVERWWTARHAAVPYQRDVSGTGCDVISAGEGGLAVLAHLDEISYLLRDRVRPGVWRVTPYCYHLAEKPSPARVIRFDPTGAFHVLCAGELVEQDGDHFLHHPAEVDLGPADRVVLASPVACDPESGLVTGSLDNAAGVAAALAAADVLAGLGLPFSCYLTDEEEGPAGSSSQTISRGAMRLLRTRPAAPMTVAVDIHGLAPAELDAVDFHRRPWGASLAEYSSGGRGSVAPPWLYHSVRELLTPLAADGVPVRANVGGYVPRSDDVVAMTYSNRVIILGYPGINRHFDRGLPTANIHDLVALARALVILGAATGSAPPRDGGAGDR